MNNRSNARVILAVVLAALAGCDSARTTAARSAPATAPATPALSTLIDLEGRPADPLAGVAARKATVLQFVTTDCPISNGYAPEIQRLASAFGPQNVAFYLVYPDPDLKPADARKHHQDYGYPFPAVLDPKFELAKLAKVETTPEAAVFLADRSEVYRGRINDLYVDYGKARHAPTSNDLKDVLEAVVGGKPPAPRTTEAIGCPIPF
jgi:hypothetical protein